jgi:ABC-type proline/glycine betaine transport system permease subunit
MLFLMLIVGGLMKDVAAYIKLPYTSLITVIGVILGIFAEAFPTFNTKIVKAIQAYSNIPPHFLLLVFLPALIFESAFNSDWHIFKA